MRSSLAAAHHNALDVLRVAYYDARMIRNFGSKDTERLFYRQRVARFQAFERTAHPDQRSVAHLFRWQDGDSTDVEIVDYH